MKKKDLDELINEVEQENRFFKNKAAFDSVRPPENIVGRKEQAKQLLQFLHVSQNIIVPFVSVYGRSGSGKSTLVKFVCDNLTNISYCFVNLRNAKTIFGCANLILAELGKANLKSAQGLNFAMTQIAESIISRLNEQKKKIFVLVLDEFDMIFYDERNNPSDFVYKLVVLGESLKKKNYLMCIVGISNNVISEYALDDRVKSRIGNSEVFFPSYTQDEAFAILRTLAREAFTKPVNEDILQYCATLGSQEHGDARRVIDLLRVGAEIASSNREKLDKSHIDLASTRLQNDRIQDVLTKNSAHFSLVCGSIAYLTFVQNRDWISTSEIYDKYKAIIPSNLNPLTYRRISGILIDIKNTGLAHSKTRSSGRKGYGTQYKLLFPPEMIGIAIDKKWWQKVEELKNQENEDAGLNKDVKQLRKILGEMRNL